jgi:hypothetical protein
MLAGDCCDMLIFFTLSLDTEIGIPSFTPFVNVKYSVCLTQLWSGRIVVYKKREESQYAGVVMLK